MDPRPETEWQQFGRVRIGGSDFHRPGGGPRLAEPTTWVLTTDRSVTALLASIGADATSGTVVAARPQGRAARPQGRASGG